VQKSKVCKRKQKMESNPLANTIERRENKRKLEIERGEPERKKKRGKTVQVQSGEEITVVTVLSGTTSSQQVTEQQGAEQPTGNIQLLQSSGSRSGGQQFTSLIKTSSASGITTVAEGGQIGIKLATVRARPARIVRQVRRALKK
jgi:hypothetical protein